jgi:hypothetical protein
VLAAPTDGAMVADSVLHNLAPGGPLQLDKSWLGHLDSAIARWFETRVEDRSSTESSDEDSLTRAEGAPDETVPDPVAAAQAGITSDPHFGLVLTLIILSSYWMNHWLNRQWGQPARRVGLTTRSVVSHAH